MSVVCINGRFVPTDEPVLLAANRSYRYGDGLFETIKVKAGELLLPDYHFDRLYKSLHLLQYEMPALFLRQRTENEILQLCKKNRCESLARVRLSVFRGNGGLYDEGRQLQYLIECWPLDEAVQSFNENGFVIDVFPDAQKSCDKYAALKTASFLPYAMAALYAKKNRLNDCIVLNTNGRVADTSIANIFIVKNDNVITPPLSEGCIDGVMRKHLLHTMPEKGFRISERPITINDLLEADEVFLTNAVKGIKWVKTFREISYLCGLSLKIYEQVLKQSS